MSMALTADNYYTAEANQRYMSHSLYKKFITCEASTMAQLTHEWEDTPSDDMLVGSYVHAAIEGTLDEFKMAHPEMYSSRGKTKGELKAEFKQAEKMIQTLVSDSFILQHLKGQKEHIITADMFGCTWKAKLDIYRPMAEQIIDIKTVRSLSAKEWIMEDHAYLSWIEAYGYTRQMAIYAELERIWSGSTAWSEPLIIAVSKEDIPDKGVYGMTHDDIAQELAIVEANMPRILDVWNLRTKPQRCEACSYCRATKQLSGVIYYRDLVV